MRCDKFAPSSGPATVRWKGRPSLGLFLFSLLPFHVRSWKASLSLFLSLSISLSPLSLLQAAFLCRYLTVVVNNPRYGFQMSLHPTLELGMGMGLEHGASVRVGHEL